MTTMRAKMRVHKVEKNHPNNESLHFNAVSASGYPNDGTDENNTYAKWTPTASLSMSITNPALFDKFAEGDVFYVDFSPTK